MKNTFGIKFYLALALLIVMMVSPAQAALIVNKVSDDFSLESTYPTSDLKACQCSTRADVLEIKNSGDLAATFKVEIYSPMGELITVSDDTFYLEPCEEQKVYVYIKTPCDQPIQSYYVARVSTSYGRSKEIYKEIVSKQCQNIKMECELITKEVLPGQVMTIKANLQNVADFQDTYQIAPLAYNEFTVQTAKELSLAPDEKGSVYFYVKFPLSYYGTLNYPIAVSSDNGNNYAECSQSLNIKRDYDFSMKTEELELSACEEVTKKTPITIKNLASTPNKYHLKLSGPAFAELSQTELSLNPGEEDTVLLNINPAQINVGEYELILSVSTEYGDMYKEKSFKLKVNDCFDSKATVEGQANLIAEKSCCGQKTYTLNLRNDGLFEEAYEVITDSPGWVSVREEDRFIRLKPSQNVNVPVTVNFPCSDSKQTSFIIVKQLRAPYQTHEIRLDLESLSERTCYNIDLMQDKYRINYDTNSISMLLQNTGVRGGTYKLALGELESRFVYIDQDTLEFKPGEIKVLHVYPRNYSTYRQGTYLNKLTLSISLLNKDCAPNCYTGEPTKINYDRQFWVVLKDKCFLSKAIDYIKNFNYSKIGWCGLASILLLLIALGMLVVVAYMRFKSGFKIKRIKASKMKKIKIFNIVLIFLLILSILALILIGNPNSDKFYEKPCCSAAEESSPLIHEWKQNNAYQIKLDQYFTDPDFDVLSYTSSQPDHIQVRIDGNIATLTPEHNWAGKEQIVFTANDEKGGVTDSPIMTLNVLKKQPVGIMGYWNAYCYHINIVLFIVIILLALLILDLVEEKGYNYYNSKSQKANLKPQANLRLASTRVKIKREKGWLYYIDHKGDVSRARMARGKKEPVGKPQLVAKMGIKKKKGYLYYINKAGYVAKSPMARNGQKK